MTTLNSVAYSQTTANDGDWKKNYVVLNNTPQAEHMIRGGDIDNLGFGWENNFNPFSGKSTETHFYPWTPDTTFAGTDRILIGSSVGKSEPPCSADGYSGEWNALKTQFGKTTQAIKIPLSIPATTIVKDVMLQLFVDDFQSPVFCSSFQVLLNGKRAPFIENIINKLNQSGPIGKLITIEIPAEYLSLFKEKQLEILIDDPTTGAHDGYAIDFVKVLINPKPGAFKKYNHTVLVKDNLTGDPLKGVIVELANGKIVRTNDKGEAILQDLVLGYHPIRLTHCGYHEVFAGVDIEEKPEAPQTFVMEVQQ